MPESKLVVSLRLKPHDREMLDDLARRLNAPAAVVLRMALHMLNEQVDSGLAIPSPPRETEEEESAHEGDGSELADRFSDIVEKLEVHASRLDELERAFAERVATPSPADLLLRRIIDAIAPAESASGELDENQQELESGLRQGDPVFVDIDGAQYPATFDGIDRDGDWLVRWDLNDEVVSVPPSQVTLRSNVMPGEYRNLRKYTVPKLRPLLDQAAKVRAQLGVNGVGELSARELISYLEQEEANKPDWRRRVTTPRSDERRKIGVPRPI